MSSSRLAILGWHNVEGTWCFPARERSGTRGLARQLHALGGVANVVPLASTLESLAGGHGLPRRAVAITFDDGYRDTLELAVPVLERLGLPATFFLVPGLLSGAVTPWWEVIPWAFARTTRSTVEWDGTVLPAGDDHAGRRSSGRVVAQMKACDQRTRERMASELVDRLQPEGETPGRLFMDWDDARELVRRGFSVGSHSMHHAILAREGPREQAEDLAGSRHELEAELGVVVDLLAYPNGQPGDYDVNTVQAARLAGYSNAITTVEGWNSASTPAYEIRRFTMYPERGVAGFAVLGARRAMALARPGSPPAPPTG